MDDIRKKLDKIDDRIASIDVTLAAQHVTLKEHIRRTELLEADVRPIKDHVTRMQGAIKLITIISLGVTLAVAVKSLFN